MSENGVMDRPRRSTRNSLASSSGATPGTPSNSTNPYKKPTYLSRGGGSETPASSKNTNGTPSSSGRGRRGRGRPPGRPSSSRGGGHQHSYQHTKPECIAVRVDGRRSTGGSTASSGGGRRGATSGGRRSTYSSKHEYEYHYGSDFESDQNDSEPEEDELESEQEEESEADSTSLAGDNDESDSDFSVSSARGTSSRLPSPPVPIWLDTEKVPDIPPLELPNSSDDLLLSREHVVKAVEIYEPLRRFHQLVRLSPFRFEDFCAALACEDQSSLLAEMHIQLLKCVIREEDANGTLFGPNEVKDSVQSIVYFIDHITWPETIRSYLESDPTWKDVYEAMISVEYPFCGPEVRIKVLGWLVDQFLTTNAVREQLLGDGTILHEDHCRACNRLGELICCESCPAVYHIECLNPPLKDPDNPPDMWKCPVCMKHQIPGVNDCTSEVEKMGLLIRHERLGYDRHGRKYWFLVRRILVESEDGSEVWYYSTRGQVEDLLSRLDASNFESGLVSNIKNAEDEIYRQIEVTEEVTRLQNTQRRKTYLDIENGKDAEGDGPERITRLKSTGLYKLGQENLFKTYVNHFISDPLAASKGKHNEERDRKRHMSHKFSLTAPSECKYGIKDLTGCTRQIQISALRGALTHMETALPTTLMHVNWPMLRKTWLANIQTGTCALDFSRAMLMISACIRNAVYNPVWSESAGHVRFSRMTLLEREERKKSEKRDKKDKDDEDDRLKGEPQFTKNPLPIRHQVYKQKGEEYRVHGRWGWLWLSNMRRCKSQDCREVGLLAGPHKHVIQVKNETGKVKTMLIDPGVYSKLMAKRNLAVTNTAAATPTSTAKPADSTSNGEASSAAVDSSSASDDKSESGKTVTNCAEDPSSSDSSIKENGGDDVEMKDDVLKGDEEQPKKSPAAADVVKVEDEEKVNQSNEDEATTSPINDSSNEKEMTVEPKEEPMEVEAVGDEQSQGEEEKTTEEEKTQEVTMVNGDMSEDMEEDKSEEQHAEKDGKGNEKVPEVEKDNTVRAKDKELEGVKNEETHDKSDVMEVDQVESSEKSVVESTDSTTTEKPTVNGNDSSHDEIEQVSKDQEATNEPKSTVSVGPTSEFQNGVTNASVPTPTTPAAAPSVTTTDSKTDDSQGRKFKTELVNVSSGLASAHRILYPKVARRCEYLDSLLHRRLTLMSLEEKQLKSTYGEEMVSKAKVGLVQFEEEEKRRAQEADEYPCEEVVDENLTLGGAYAFCCYSAECRKEAKEFMKVKGKNRERIYEKICYSPMCRLKFCLQETTRFKQERMREMEKDKYYKVFKEIEDKRQYTLEGTSHKLYMKKLPDCLTVAPSTPASGGIGGATSSSALQCKKKPKTPQIKYPQLSSFRYATSKKQSILVLPPFELKRLARTAGRHFTPTGFFPNQKSGSWGWSLPCGRPVFRTAWQYKITHAKTLATAAMQLRILYASIRWDDILAKIPNNDGRHQVHTDTEIITTEILNHRIVGRFMERVQYLRRMQVVPIDAPKTIREITPSRIGLRKRKRAESPDKTEPVVSEDWVDEEKLELWEIRFYGDRIDRKHTGVIGRFSDSNSPSTRTKSGIAIKQPEKYDPSHNPTSTGERRTYAAHPNPHHNPTQQQQQQPIVAGSVVSNSSVSSSASSTSSISDSVESTIEHVIRNHDPSRQQGDGKTVSAVKTAELMRETIETEMKMQRAVHLSKRDSHAKHNANGGPNNGTKQGVSTPVPQPTASQQFQMQQNAKGATSASTSSGGIPAGKNAPAVSVGTPTSSKVGGVVVGRKFFANRQSTGATTTSDGAILTKRPLQNTITINKGAGGTISVVKNNPAPPTTPVQPQQPHSSQQPVSQSQAPPQVPPTTLAVTTLQQPMTNVAGQSQNPIPAAGIMPQKLSVMRLADGRLQVRGLLPGQHCYQTADGRIHVTVHSSQIPNLQQAAKQGQAQTPPVIISSAGAPPAAPTQPMDQSAQQQAPPNQVTDAATPVTQTPAHATTSAETTPAISSTTAVSNATTTPIATAIGGEIPPAVTALSQQQVTTSQPMMTTSTAGVMQTPITTHVVVSSQQSQQPVINISNQAVKSNISSATGLVATTGPNNKQTITIQQPPQPQRQIIIQQPNGQQLIIQGAAAEALLQQQQQQKLAAQQRALQLAQTSLASQQQMMKQVTSQSGQVATVKTPVILQTSSGPAVGGVVTTNPTVPGRIVIQDGKTVLIGSATGVPAAATSQQPQRNVIVNAKQMVQTSSGVQASQQTIVRPQMIQTSTGGQLIQGGAVQLIQSGQGLHFIAQQATSQSQQAAVTHQIITSSASGTAQVVTSAVTTGTGVFESVSQSSSGATSVNSGVVSSPSKTNVVVSTAGSPTVTTAVKHVLADGRTVLLSPSQFGDLTGGGRKVILNKQVLQLPTSTATSIRPTAQQQLIQSLVGSGPGTIQIFQGPGGQQFLIQQPAAATQQSAAAAMLQQAQQQQQQVQFVVPGGQLGGQPLLVKKYVKPTAPTAGTSPAGSPAVVNKTSGNLVQLASTAQNQLTQLLGPNKALVRLDNNQLAAIQLPVPQVQTVTSSTPQAVTSVASPKTSVVQSSPQQTIVSTPTTPTTPQQQQTTITRTPGLPISIVSPSKSKVQQQSPKTQGAAAQIVSSSPTPPSTVASSTTTPSTPTGSATTQFQNKTPSPTVIRMSSPVVKGSPAQRAASPLSQPAKPATPTTSQPTRMPSAPTTPSSPVIPSVAVVSTPVIATKSAPPPIQVTTSPPVPIIVSSQTQQPQISATTSPSPIQVVQQTKPPVTPVSTHSIPVPTTPTPIITATKSQPPPLPQETSSPIAVKSLPPPTTPTLLKQKTVAAASPGPIAVKSAPPPVPSTSASSVPASPVNSTPSSLPTTPKAKAAPSKIVAQIFQTPQGPKVVIQGVNPGELTQSQMLQLQAQIQKQLAAQQQTQLQTKVVQSPTSKGKVGGATPAVMPPASSAVVQQQQSSIAPQQNSVASPIQQQSSLPTILQSKQQSNSPLTASSLSAQHQSPVEVLRSSSSSHVSHSSSVTSPILPRSPPPTTMVSPSKVLSPPANLPTLLSPPKSMVGRQDMVAALSSVREPSVPGSPTILTSPGQPVVVARKSQPRKSPIRPNNLDSPPPPPMMMSPPPPPPVVHNNVNSVAMELMRPLNSEQQEILADRRNALKEDIMEKKKAAATQMRLEAQREIQEKQKAVELANSKVAEQTRVVVQQHNTVNEGPPPPKGAKKRKMDNSIMESSNSRSPSGPMSPGSTSGAGNSTRGPRGRGGGKRGKRKLLCVCKTPYDKDKFYVGCDKCENWFHGDCIGITEEMSKDLPEYICDDCRDDKLYCMCKKPYNDSQFYIQCDKCEDWFHGRCVGVLQGESDTIGDYICPQCEPNSEINLPNAKKLDAGDYVTVSRLLKEMLSNRSSQPFRKPVTKAQAPNYFSIIKEPMDLQTITNRVEEKKYECLREFIGDVGRIFENCRYYNDPKTDIFRHADNLEKFFVQKVWTLRQTLNTRLQ